MAPVILSEAMLELRNKVDQPGHNNSAYLYTFLVPPVPETTKSVQVPVVSEKYASRKDKERTVKTREGSNSCHSDEKHLHGLGGFLLSDCQHLHLCAEFLTFSYATGNTNGWKPPKCLDLSENGTELKEPQESWMGRIDRYELVRCFRRTVNFRGQRCTPAEIEFGVKLFECAENFMINEHYDSSYRCFVELIRRYPSLTLGYYKCGLCIIQTYRDAPLSEEARTEVFKNFGQATEFWRCAVSLEPLNRSLAGNIDMVMRLFVGMPVPSESLYRDHALYPKSLADAVLIARLQGGQKNNE